MDEWRTEILDGVVEVNFGGIPGIILVSGESSTAVIANTRGQVLCAVAELGKGRVVVFSHNSLLGDFENFERNKFGNERFNRNVIKWITKGTEDGTKIQKFGSYIGTLDKLPADSKVLTWSGWPELTTEARNQLFEWIEGGGGLICGCCPWGVSQLKKVPVSCLPLTQILSKIGMAFAGKMHFKKDTGNKVLMADNLAHLSKLSSLSEAIKTQEVNENLYDTIVDHVCHLPDELFNRHESTFMDLIHHLSPNNDHVPVKNTPIKCMHRKNAAILQGHVMVRQGIMGNQVIADGINDFPGTFDKNSELENISVELYSDGLKRRQATGYYLPAGTTLEVSWEGNRIPWKLYIGAHTDNLQNKKATKAFERWPMIISKTHLGPTKTECNVPKRVSSPFGGLIYIRCSKAGPDDQIKINMHNVVRSPMFTYETAEKWGENSKNPGIWCDVIGKRIAFTLPSRSVRDLSDLTETMKLWDAVVETYIDLLGKDASNGRGQWVVSDIQPSAGYMHSGYPIVTHLDVTDQNRPNIFQFQKENIMKEGRWGLFHEIGHNFQNGLWTWQGTGEVTCNIFTLHAMDKICGIKPWLHPWLQKQLKGVKSFFEGGADFKTWSSKPGVALFVYAQLARDFGWDSYKKVFRIYNDLPKDSHPKTKEDKINLWVTTFSEVVKKNLSPLFDFWGWPIKEFDEISKFPMFLPDDDITNDIGKERAMAIREIYTIDISKDDEDRALDNIDVSSEDQSTCGLI